MAYIGSNGTIFAIAFVTHTDSSNTSFLETIYTKKLNSEKT